LVHYSYLIYKNQKNLSVGFGVLQLYLKYKILENLQTGFLPKSFVPKFSNGFMIFRVFEDK